MIINNFKNFFMKKIILFSLFALMAIIGFSQDYSKVQLSTLQGKFEDAKKEIDKLIADPKANDKAETWFWKLSVYAELFADSNLYKKYPDADRQALDAFNQYNQKDNTIKELKDNPRPVGLLYSQSFNLGRDYFSKSQWEQSFGYFKTAADLSEYVSKNELRSDKKTTIDTFTILYTSYAAQNANKPDEAAKYYSKLADQKIGGKDFEDLYKFILDYYSKHSNPDAFNKYLATAKELYTADGAIWSQLEMNEMTANASLDELMTKYNAADAAGKLNENAYIGYAEAFASPDKAQQSKLDSAKQVELKLAAADAFKKAFALNNSNGIYAFNAGVLYYNIYSVLDERYYDLRGESADLKAKRDEVGIQEKDYADKAIEWLEKGYTILKAKTPRERSENSSLNRAVDYLAKVYAWKRDKSKGVDPKSYDMYDAKMNQYDKEHDTYH